MLIKDYFNTYEKFSKSSNLLRKFSIISQKQAICKYLKLNKNFIINNINYCFFESEENYLISVFTNDNLNYIHINSRKTKEYPRAFENQENFEVFLSIFATISVLLNLNYQITNLNDSRLLLKQKEKIEDITYCIYYDEKFNLNLSNYINDKLSYIKNIYYFGEDFLFCLFKNFYLKNILKEDLFKILNIDEEDFKKLYSHFKLKIKKNISDENALNRLKGEL
ncbi:hypothetical protein MLB78_001642 [Campylobacter jejuni]|nr:hypothetical protein [Campylobacter jejuni]EAK2198148.1 hypothetical protein [Campylobacter jejuni]EIX8463338.1 hypothetical protein [Campylobacter jejuni]EKI4982960.1 hypothetical protein [Campylobacter jejuni]ELE6181792.1 hypothetical protein [Campylobacter jejuni]